MRRLRVLLIDCALTALAGIFALLLVITSVLCGVAGFFVYVARRTAQLDASSGPLPENLSEPQTNA
jgi:hypothetical protein